MSLNLTKEQFQKYVDIGISRQRIADELGTTLGKLRTWMKNNQVSLQGRQYTCNKLPINSQFWGADKPAQAYWAGFIAADGSVSRDGRLEVGLSIKDLEHLEKLKTALGSSHTIERKLANGKYPSCYFRPRDQEIVEDLALSYNIHPGKTSNYTIPEWLLKHPLLSHFLRGYVDGDGCLYCKERASLTITSGSPIFVGQIMNILQSIGSTYSISNYGTYDNVVIGSKASIVLVLDYLYHDSTEATRLSRKYVKFNEIKNKLKV